MKKAIVVVSCGTSYEKTLERAIGGCENRIREAFSDYDVRRAFTSNTAIGKLEKRDNIHVDTVEEALGKLKDQGYSEVIVQSLHIINGDEHDKVKEQASAFHNQFDRLIIGEPLLTDRQDYEIVIAALFSQIPVLEKDEAVVFMGQGSGHYSFSAYACLDHMLRDTPMFLACMESYPELDIIIGELEEKDKKKVHLMPFMLVADEHVIHDMASEDKESWNSQLQRAGFETTCYSQGLGENPAIQTEFVKRIFHAMEKEKSVCG